MGSEAPARFFYKDKKKNIIGPLTKGAVLQRYGKNHFKNSFSFCLLAADEERTPQTKFHTLGDLIKSNGSKDPFKKAPESSNQNSDELEEQADETANALEDVHADNGRQSQLSTGPMWVIVNTAWQLGPQANAPAIMTPDELANAWAAYYLDVLEAYKTNEWDKVYEKAVGNIDPVKRAVANSAAVSEKCYRELMIKLINLDHAYCYECGSIFHNYKQILMHVTAEHHNKPDSDELQTLKKDVNDLMWMICKESCLYNLTQEEDKHIEWVKLHRDDDFAAPDLRPLKGFVNDITQEYVRAIFGDHNAGDEDTFAQMVAKMIPRLKTDDFRTVSEIMHILDEHIGNKQTRCFECNAVTGNKDQYYEHMLTFAHIIESNGMDLITLIVNLYKRPDNPVITEVQEPCEQSQPTSRSSTEDLSPTSSSSAAAIVAPAVANAAPAATAAKKPEEDISEDAKVANAWAAYYVEVLKAYETNEFDNVFGGKEKTMLEPMVQVHHSDSLRKKSREVLTEKLKALANSRYAFCFECDSIFHNYKQILLHVDAEKHNLDDDKSDALHEIQKNVNMMMRNIFWEQLKGWHEEEHMWNKKHIDRPNPKHCPSDDFRTKFESSYGIRVRGDERKNAKFSPAQIVDRMFRRLKSRETKQGASLGSSMIEEVDNHLKDKLTRCSVCEMATGSRTQYYKHLKTFAHLSKADGTDLITFVVNVYKKD